MAADKLLRLGFRIIVNEKGIDMSIKVIELDEKTKRIEDGFVYCYLLEGDEKALLLDTGVTGEVNAECVKSLTSLPVILANTHGDGDHVAGNGSFDGFYIHPLDYANRDLKGRFNDTVQKDLTDGMCFDLGGRIVKAIEIPGHTLGSVAFLDETYRVLYSGDSVQNSTIYMFGNHRAPGKFEESLKKLIALKDGYDRVRACHGTPSVSADYAEKVLSDWTAVLSGKASYTDEELYCNPVRTYKGESCGFYCERTFTAGEKNEI